MRKKDETLQSIILDLAREMAETTGPDSINIRAIAKKAGIATGTVYNYFPSKDDILLALTREYWEHALTEMRETIRSGTFYDQLEEIYTFLSKQIRQSAGMLMGSLRNVETIGREQMQSMQQVLRAEIIQRMEQDAAIREEVWDDTFTKEQYATFVIRNMTFLLQMKIKDISFFLEIIKRTLY